MPLISGVRLFLLVPLAPFALVLAGASQGRERRGTVCPGGPPFVSKNVAAVCAGHFPTESADQDFSRWIVFFYGKDCRRCEELMPFVDSAAERSPPPIRQRAIGSRRRPTLLYGSVDCHHVKNQLFCKNQGIWKLPVLKALARGSQYTDKYEAARIHDWAISAAGTHVPLPSMGGQQPLCPAFELYDESKQAQAFLQAHNVYRCVSGLKLLEWDRTLWESARRWALQAPADRLQHSPVEQRRGPRGTYGENVAISDSADWLRPGRVVARWYSEMRNTDAGRVTGKLRTGIGHYTQIVWRDTRRVGCSMEQNQRVVVCQYDPAGNMRGKYITQVVPPLAAYTGSYGEERCGGPVDEIGL